jgi:replicative DNA helicase
MECHRKRENRNLEVGDITRGLKILAKELKIPILLLSQLNRGTSEFEKPDMRSLRESGSIEQDLNKLIMLWKISELPDGSIVVGCSVELNRRGRTGVVQLRFDGSHMRFTETEDRYDPPKERKRKQFE